MSSSVQKKYQLDNSHNPYTPSSSFIKHITQQIESTRHFKRTLTKEKYKNVF